MNRYSVAADDRKTSAPRLDIDRGQLALAFDREPLGFSHSLSELGLFKLESLHVLAQKMSDHPRDYFIAESAPSPGAEFYSVPNAPYKPPEAIEKLGAGALRILLKRPEDHDRDFKELIATLFAQVVDCVPRLANERIVRLESGILISSAATITPFHMDPECGFFSQIEGEKMYHVYSPAVITERELEQSATAGCVKLTPVELTGRDPAREYVFKLVPGKGFHQPHNAPHWVETGRDRSISYTFVFETEASRARARTRAFNHYMRRLQVNPAVPGCSQTGDAVKSHAMQAIRAVTPLRRLAGRVIKNVVKS